MRHGWEIVRTRPVRRTYGVALPVFIHNLSFYLATLNVYSDGAIDAWGFVDRALFDKKLSQGWVDPQPTRGARLSIHNLGGGLVAEARHESSREDIGRWVDETIARLNPSGEGLLDMQGTDVEVRNGMRYAKLGLADERPFRRDPHGVESRGAALPVLVPEGNQFRLDHWFVFEDGSSRLGPAGPLASVGDIAAMFDRRQLLTAAPEDAWLHVPGLGRYMLRKGFWDIEPGERVKEAFDELDQLRGSPGAVATCRAAFRVYQASPTEQARAHLRQTYEAVPRHLRLYCGDMDSKDSLIRAALDAGKNNDDA